MVSRNMNNVAGTGCRGVITDVAKFVRYTKGNVGRRRNVPIGRNSILDYWAHLFIERLVNRYPVIREHGHDLEGGGRKPFQDK
jgi:hypothetical protein